jgi:cytochrome o ubiquinol oxidase subunit 2
MKRVFLVSVPIVVAICLIALFYVLVKDAKIDVLQPAGDIAQAQRGIILFTVALSAVVVIPVFTLLAFISIKYRAGNKKATYSPEWGENKWLEGLWWGIPILIIGILGVVIYQTSHSLDPYKPIAGDDQLEVQVVALRWKWLFIYPEQNVVTLNHLPLPIDRPVHFTMTADAPMSAFWIPALGSQVYAMNGMESQLHLKPTKLGEYTGYTTNINGEGYAKMTFETRVMNSADFDTWSADASEAPDSMTMRTYEELAKPKSDPSEKTYRLANAKLFEMIVERYGHSHSAHGGSH